MSTCQCWGIMRACAPLLIWHACHCACKRLHAPAVKVRILYSCAGIRATSIGYVASLLHVAYLAAPCTFQLMLSRLPCLHWSAWS